MKENCQTNENILAKGDKNNTFQKYHLTNPQKRIWYLEQINAGTSMNNIGGYAITEQALDILILEQAVNKLLENNDALRLRFKIEDGEIIQYVMQHTHYELKCYDFTKYDNPFLSFNQWLESGIKQPFAIEEEPLYFIAMIKLEKDRTGYVFKLHHLISDGWSFKLISDQISHMYEALIYHTSIREEVLPSYLNYIKTECDYLNSNLFLKDKEFWNNKYSNLTDPLFSVQSSIRSGKRKTFHLEKKISEAIKFASLEKSINTNQLLLTAYLILLSKISDKEHVVTSLPVFNRIGKISKNTIGMFTSTMPFKIEIFKDETVSALIQRVKKELKSCYLHQRYPYNFLIRDLELKSKGHENLYQVSFNYYNFLLVDELCKCPLYNTEFYNGEQSYVLQIIVRDWSGAGDIFLDFDYITSYFSEMQIDLLYKRYTKIIIEMLKDEFCKIENIDLLLNGENKKLIYQYNTTTSNFPMYKTIVCLFEEQVKRTPDEIVISINDINISYKQLSVFSNKLAMKLKKYGIRKNSIVGIMAVHSIEFIMGILAILKAGGAYLPLDPALPTERINYMIRDAKIDLLLTYGIGENQTNFNGDIWDIKKCMQMDVNEELCHYDSSPSELAYVIYTSGSTGHPKGVMINHINLVNYIWWARRMYVKNNSKTFAFYSSIAFDLTQTSIFVPLISGGTIIVYQEKDDEFILNKILEENRVNIIKLTPSHLELLKDKDYENSLVKTLIVGGESFKTELAAKIYENFHGIVDIYNEYGPTEATVGCMIYKYNYFEDKRVTVPIGSPADNVQIYILNKDMKPVLEGDIGEIYIGGTGVGRGYMNQVELTFNKFVNNPFLHGEIMYRTGDLARFIENGVIEYVGRSDRQVKIRGHRIELDEIENVINCIDGVKGSVVNVINSHDLYYLCGYIVASADTIENYVKPVLMERLPNYMIPAFLLSIDTIPLTKNGKIDIHTLPLPDFTKKSHCDCKIDGEMAGHLISVIRQVLKNKNIEFGHDFYQIGGDSISAIQISSKLREVDIDIKAKDILKTSLISDMVPLLKKRKEEIAIQKNCIGEIEPTPILLWFQSQKLNEINFYNQSVVLKLKSNIRYDSLKIALNFVIATHDSFRINYDIKRKCLFYNDKYRDRIVDVEIIDLSGLKSENIKENFQIYCQKIKGSFDIENERLFKASIFQLEDDNSLLFMTAHHLIVDGVSWRIFLQDLDKALYCIENQQEIELVHEKTSYQDWAIEIKKYSDSLQLKEQLQYWRNVYSEPFKLQINEKDDSKIESCRTVTEVLPLKSTENLLTIANSVYNTRPEELMIAALALTLSKYANSKSIVLELEGHGREELLDGVDISKTVGWFTSIYPVRLDVEYTELGNQLKSLKEQLRNVPNKGMGYGILRYLKHELDHGNKKYVRFNYLGNFDYIADSSFFDMTDIDSGPELSGKNSLTCLWDVTAFVFKSQLIINITYCENMFAHQILHDFICDFVDQLDKIVLHCISKEGVEFTPSDFENVKISQEDLGFLFQ